MSVVNLNKARKAKVRETTRATAAANAVKFGQTKAEKALQAARSEKAQRDLDGQKKE